MKCLVGWLEPPGQQNLRSQHGKDLHRPVLPGNDPQRPSLCTPNDNLDSIENGTPRSNSEDTSSEIQSSGSVSTIRHPESHRDTGSGALARMHREVERPDSFLERFRTPELKEASSREQHTVTGIPRQSPQEE
ncbi:cyclic nucleotide-gated cation channel alpha-3-like, partial [Oncorhynchus masou masou]|uniref:cyclic nucleotide-gated cation channel alpha-3-like n=1 Tax=Oncorhynchus masou masou TaxID=90313 RepID=UPI0031831BDA